MEKETGLHHIFATIEPSKGLCGSIMARIDTARRRAAKVRASLFAFVALVSGAALVPIVEYTAHQLYASGFYEYLSLALSDHSLAFTYWREFSLSLLESLPSVALLLLLPVVAALLWSLVRLTKNARTGFAYAQSA